MVYRFIGKVNQVGRQMGTDKLFAGIAYQDVSQSLALYQTITVPLDGEADPFQLDETVEITIKSLLPKKKKED